MITYRAVVVAAVLSIVASPVLAATYEDFQYPGGFFTTARAVNAAGVVAGEYYSEDTSVSHGFVRSADGQLSSFDAAADAVFTFVGGINDAGTIVGSYMNTDGATRSYVRTAAGVIVAFTFPGSLSTQALGINANGAVVGNYVDGSGDQHGFLRAADGTFTAIDIPGAALTGASSINQSNVIAGEFLIGFDRFGFFGTSGATATTFQPLGSIGTYPKSINDAGVIAGEYQDAAFRRHGFVRRTDGSFFVFDAPGAIDTYVNAMSQSGDIAGAFLGVGGLRGYVRDGAGNITIAAPDGATYSFAAGLNSDGVSVGYWEDENFVGQAFLRIDCQAPTFTSISATPNSIWPPNNKMVPVSVSAATSGGCGEVTSKIVSISSNDPDAGASDWSITGPLSATVRASKAKSGDRVYVITVEATDATLKTASGTVTVTVPANRNR